jgi:hypothetical protein
VERGNFAPQTDIDRFGKKFADRGHRRNADVPHGFRFVGFYTTRAEYNDDALPLIGYSSLLPGANVAREARATNREVLGSVIENAIVTYSTRGHAAAHARTLLEYSDLDVLVRERSGAREPGDAGPDDRCSRRSC